MLKARALLGFARSRWAIPGIVLIIGGVGAAVVLLRNDSPAQGSSRQAARLVPDGGSPPPVNWKSPFIDSVRVTGVAAAASKLAFVPVLPPSLGQPASVVVRGDVSTPADQAVGFVFDNAPFGRFIAIEEPTQMSQDELENLAKSCDPAQGCEGTWSLIKLQDGTRALRIDGPVSNGVMWLHNGIRLDVFGPPDGFAPEAALTVANAFSTPSG